MSSHHLKNTTVMFPNISRYQCSGNNTNVDLRTGLKSMSETPEYKREFNPGTGELSIWYVRENDVGCKYSLCNKYYSCSITIAYFTLGQSGKSEIYSFNHSQFSDLVNENLLTPDDLEQQRAFNEQNKLREDALKNAHESNPKTCHNSTCKFCRNEESRGNEHAQASNEAENYRIHGPNWRKVLSYGLGYT